MALCPLFYPWLRLRNPIDPEVHVCICQVRSNIDASQGRVDNQRGRYCSDSALSRSRSRENGEGLLLAPSYTRSVHVRDAWHLRRGTGCGNGVVAVTVDGSLAMVAPRRAPQGIPTPRPHQLWRKSGGGWRRMLQPQLSPLSMPQTYRPSRRSGRSRRCGRQLPMRMPRLQQMRSGKPLQKPRQAGGR
jgi:hypothetical protein